MNGITAVMVCGEHEEYADLAVKSAVTAFDRVVIVGNPDLKTINKIYSSPKHLHHKITLQYRAWDGDYGEARTDALKLCSKGEFVFQLDMDECLSDNTHVLYEEINENPRDFYDIPYTHYVYHLGQVDATEGKHVGLRRFFVNNDVTYSSSMHELAESKKWTSRGIVEEVRIHHLGYLKGIRTIMDKYKKNLLSSPVHSTDFLVGWKNDHVLGAYATRPYDKKKDGEYPWPIRELFGVQP